MGCHSVTLSPYEFLWSIGWLRMLANRYMEPSVVTQKGHLLYCGGLRTRAVVRSILSLKKVLAWASDQCGVRKVSPRA